MSFQCDDICEKLQTLFEKPCILYTAFWKKSEKSTSSEKKKQSTVNKHNVCNVLFVSYLFVYIYLFCRHHVDKKSIVVEDDYSGYWYFKRHTLYIFVSLMKSSSSIVFLKQKKHQILYIIATYLPHTMHDRLITYYIIFTHICLFILNNRLFIYRLGLFKTSYR